MEDWVIPELLSTETVKNLLLKVCKTEYLVFIVLIVIVTVNHIILQLFGNVNFK